MSLRRFLSLSPVLFGLFTPQVAQAEDMVLFGAGSLSQAMTEIIRRFPAGADKVASAEFGPSGLMREKIEAGAPADIFASADMAHARRLAAGRPDRPVINFVRNSLCALARPAVGLTSENMLERWLDPKIRLGTSTPGADPSGDYALATFRRAEAVRRGAGDILLSKALKLVGGGDKTPLLVPGMSAVAGVFIADKADIMLSYCSSALAVLKEVPELSIVRLPPDLAVGPAYGLVVLTGKPVAARFANFVMSETGQAVLRAYGFEPVSAAEQSAQTPALLLQRAGAPAIALSREELEALPVLEQTVKLRSGHGEDEAVYAGPTLWEVLSAKHLIDSAKIGDQARLVVHVRGTDGYVASLALAEISPAFGAKPVQIALRRNGEPVKGGIGRLIVPGDQRAGRSVQDIARIDIE